eukprot:CAMPEP_0170226816 /NCGR_PEP_ID=MMETSP0116_2-20130129/13120_1 /TAXON_ID=400756 /ORGANISM="Durinskia baltica, Strain CSIRO CS-38" /LENGTH=274 /DNA_ID=CAMNT_0010477543 /DNA_START=63 /DNA_END=887 /DNA_ORIENTATION=+
MWAVWDVTSRAGLRPTSWLGWYYSDTVCCFSASKHPGVQGLVALTIDDGLCRQEKDRAMVKEVRELLAKHNAKATFMLCSDYVDGLEEDARALIADGHEFGNHCPEDREYASLPPERFEEELLKTNRKIEGLVGEGRRIRWFRAPQARYNAGMREVIQRHGLRHALGDTYCDDWAVEDAQWIAATMLRQVGSGSVLINHFPERGFREHIFEALRLILEGLAAKGLRAVTLSTLVDIAEGPGIAATPLAVVEPGEQAADGIASGEEGAPTTLASS